MATESPSEHIKMMAHGSDAGHVRVFSWNGSNWVQLGNDIDGEAVGDFLGGLFL